MTPAGTAAAANPTNPEVYIPAAQNVMAESAKNTADKIFRATVEDPQLTREGLLKKYTIKNLKEEVKKLDTKTVYSKLFSATLKNILKDPDSIIIDFFDGKNFEHCGSANWFIGSFVFREAKNTVDQLESRANGALDDLALWSLC